MAREKKDGTIDKRTICGPAKKLTSKQKQALGLFLSGMTSFQICKTVDIQAHTLTNWINHSKPFRDALALAVKDIEKGVERDVRAMVKTSMTVVSELMGNSNPAIRMQAAKMAWDMNEGMQRRLNDAQQLESLERRLEALTEAQNGGSVGALPEPGIVEAEVTVEEDQADQ